jgi:hypothetical protein
MAQPIFGDKSHQPHEDELIDVLGEAAALWSALKEQVSAQCVQFSEEWVYSGKPYGWSLRLKEKKRAIIYLTPWKGYFRVAFAFGEKAALAAHQSELPPSVLEIIDNAPKYAEGRAIRLEVRSDADVQIAAKLAAIKLAN